MTDYEKGAFAVLDILKKVRGEYEAPLRNAGAGIGPGYVALNGLSHWSQSIASEVESRALQHLMAVKYPKATPCPE